MAAQDPLLAAITPAMSAGSGMDSFAEQFPRQFHDVAIAEQHAVTLAAGMACDGLKPVVAIYSTFLQRGYDQLIHDVALQNLPMVLALDRAGIVGADGATHAGAYDIAYIRCVPNMSLLTPSDERECRMALSTAHAQSHPVAVRYPRGAGVGVDAGSDLETFDWGKGVIRRQASPTLAGQPRVAILAFGTLLQPALKAAEEINASVADMRFAKPLDMGLVLAMAGSHDALVTIEDGCLMGGAGSAVMEALQAAGVVIPVLSLGYPDIFIEHGDPAKLNAQLGLDAAGIEQSIRQRFFQNQAAAA